MRQIVYASHASGDGRADLHAILEQSRHNNALDGVTGLLWSDGRRFMQVLEGPDESVGPTFDRISADPRHGAIEVLSDREIGDREFGYWSMAFRERRDTSDDVEERMRRRIADASDTVRDAFERLLRPD